MIELLHILPNLKKCLIDRNMKLNELHSIAVVKKTSYLRMNIHRQGRRKVMESGGAKNILSKEAHHGWGRRVKFLN